MSCLNHMIEMVLTQLLYQAYISIEDLNIFHFIKIDKLVIVTRMH